MEIVVKKLLLFCLLIDFNCLSLATDTQTIGFLFDSKNAQAEVPIWSTTAFRKLPKKVPKIEFGQKIQYVSENDAFAMKKTICSMVSSENGISAIVNAALFDSTNVAEALCDQLKIPYILTSWNSGKFATNYTLNFYPDSKLLAKGVSVLINSLHWKSFVLLYDDYESVLKLQDVFKLQPFDMDEKKNTIKVIQLNQDTDYRVIFKAIRDMRENNIILDCKKENLMSILLKAKETNMLEWHHNYFLTSLDAHTIDYESLESKANISTIRLFNPENEYLKQLIREWEFTESHLGRNRELSPYKIETSTILMSDALHHLVDSMNRTNIDQEIASKSLDCDGTEQWEDGARIFNFMKEELPSSVISDPIKFDSSGKRVDFNIYLISGFRNETLGLWNAFNPNTFVTNRTAQSYEAAIATNLQTQVIRVATRLGAPYLMATTDKDNDATGNRPVYKGYSMDLITHISKKLNFTFEFYLVKDKQIGAYNEKTGEWNGLVRELLDFKADLAICDLTMTHQRRKVVDFSMPFMSLGISILYQKQVKADVDMFAFLDPFSKDIWVYTGTLYLISTIALYFLYRLAPDEWENPHPCVENPEELENIWDIKNCLWLTLGSIMAQGCDLLPKGVSSRMSTSMWWFFSLIMTSSYTANLAAFLTIQQGELTVKSAEGLADQTKIKYGCMEGGSTQTFFKEATYPAYEKMYTTMMANKDASFLEDNPAGVKRVQDPKTSYAFLMESSQIEYEMITKCDLKKIGDNLDDKFYAIAMPMKSSYVGLINSAVLNLSETGVLDRLKKKWWEDERTEPVCVASAGEEESDGSLGLANMGGIFFVLGIGVALAYLVAIGEFLWNVRNVSVEEHITFMEALKIETKFAFSFWIKRKQTKCPTPSSSSASSQSGEGKHSRARSILKSASSLFSLNRIGNTS